MNRQMPSMPALSRRAALAGAAQALVLLAAACTPAPSAPSSPTEPPAPVPTPDAATPAAAASAAAPAVTTTSLAEPILLPTQGPACAGALAAVIPPTPIPYPGYTEREPSTGLHVTAPPHVIELATYRLAVKGMVANELSLTYDELRCLPKIAAYTRIECPGFFVDWSNLAGASLASVVALAGPLEGAKLVGFTGVDGRTNAVTLTDVQASKYFLAYEWEGEPLPVSHGFPVRAVLTDNAGGYFIKWLQEINIS